MASLHSMLQNYPACLTRDQLLGVINYRVMNYRAPNEFKVHNFSGVIILATTVKGVEVGVKVGV